MIKPTTLGAICRLIDGRLQGAADTPITGINAMETAVPGDITYVYQKKYIPMIAAAKAAAYILPEEFQRPDIPGKQYIIVKNARIAFSNVVELLLPPKKESGQVSPKAHVDPSVSLGNNVTVYPNVYIGSNTTIGDDATIYPGVFIGDDVTIGSDTFIRANCSIYSRTRIGRRCLISANTVIGSDGFGFIQTDGYHKKIPHVGRTVIHDDVEIGACCAIDRGTFNQTSIGKGSKIDNHVHIAHNVQIGEYNLLAGQTGFSGSVTTGKNCIFLGKSGVAPGVTVHEDTLLFQSGIILYDNHKGGQWRGERAKPHAEYLREAAGVAYIEALRKRVKSIEHRLDQMKRKE